MEADLPGTLGEFIWGEILPQLWESGGMEDPLDIGLTEAWRWEGELVGLELGEVGIRKGGGLLRFWLGEAGSRKEDLFGLWLLEFGGLGGVVLDEEFVVRPREQIREFSISASVKWPVGSLVQQTQPFVTFVSLSASPEACKAFPTLIAGFLPFAGCGVRWPNGCDIVEFLCWIDRCAYYGAAQGR
jgi:hypothetical protein